MDHKVCVRFVHHEYQEHHDHLVPVAGWDVSYEHSLAVIPGKGDIVALGKRGVYRYRVADVLHAIEDNSHIIYVMLVEDAG